MYGKNKNMLMVEPPIRLFVLRACMLYYFNYVSHVVCHSLNYYNIIKYNTNDISGLEGF